MCPRLPNPLCEHIEISYGEDCFRHQSASWRVSLATEGAAMIEQRIIYMLQ